MQGVNAVTYAPWAFTKGSQVYENYGQPNHIYFKYHGFVLDSNTHDCVSLPVGVTTLETAEVQAVRGTCSADCCDPL